MSTSLFQNVVQNGGLTVGGQLLVNSPNGPTWANISSSTIPEPTLVVAGNAEIGGTLTIGGQNITKSIDERLSAIEERLCILRVDEKLADRWEELGEMRKRYRELEQECWEKDEIIRLLKGKS